MKKYRQDAFNWMYYKQQERTFCESFCKSDRPNSITFNKKTLILLYYALVFLLSLYKVFIREAIQWRGIMMNSWRLNDEGSEPKIIQVHFWYQKSEEISRNPFLILKEKFLLVFFHRMGFNEILFYFLRGQMRIIIKNIPFFPPFGTQKIKDFFLIDILL